jgi:transcriptional regulator with XRE-family HTH domain
MARRREEGQVLADFGATVRRIRLDQGMTQERLAELSGLHPTYVSDLERGERNLGLINVHRVAFALGVDAADLFPKKARLK